MFDTVRTFRAIKEKISVDIADMDAEQIKEYLKSKKGKARKVIFLKRILFVQS